MCGRAGRLSPHVGGVAQDLLRHMADTPRHCGPDDSDLRLVWTADDRRLSSCAAASVTRPGSADQGRQASFPGPARIAAGTPPGQAPGDAP